MFTSSSPHGANVPLNIPLLRAYMHMIMQNRAASGRSDFPYAAIAAHLIEVNRARDEQHARYEPLRRLLLDVPHLERRSPPAPARVPWPIQNPLFRGQTDSAAPQATRLCPKPEGLRSLDVGVLAAPPIAEVTRADTPRPAPPLQTHASHERASGGDTCMNDAAASTLQTSHRPPAPEAHPSTDAPPSPPSRRYPSRKRKAVQLYDPSFL